MVANRERESTKFRIYWASRPPPESVEARHLNQLIPVDFSTEQDAIHAAALLVRAGEFVWLIERPGEPPMQAREIRSRCEPLLRVFGESR